MATEEQKAQWLNDINRDMAEAKKKSNPAPKGAGKSNAYTHIDTAAKRIGLEFESAFPTEADLDYKLAVLSGSRNVLGLALKDKNIVLDWTMEEFLAVLDDYIAGARPLPEGANDILFRQLKQTILELMDEKDNPLPKGNVLGQLDNYFAERIKEIQTLINQQKSYNSEADK